MSYDIELVDLEPMATLYGSARCASKDLGTTYANLISASFQHASRAGAEMAGPPFSRCTELSDTDRDVDAGIVVDREVPSGEGVAFGYLSSGAHAMTVHKGPYELLANAYEALVAWVVENRYESVGHAFEFYVNDPSEVASPADYETEVYLPVKSLA